MPSTPTQLNNDLSQALIAFSRSPRFELFKGIEIGRLLPEECQSHPDLSALTLQDLLERFLRGDQDGYLITAEQESSLLHLLRALVDDGDEAVSTTTPAQMAPPLESSESYNETIQEEQSPPPDEHEVSSVKLELDLREQISAIVAHPSYESARRRTLGEFWDKSWTPAPFEEAFTLGQLAKMDLAQLFKKRMVNDNRINNIVRALRRAKDELDRQGRIFGSASASIAEPHNQECAPVARVSEVATLSCVAPPLDLRGAAKLAMHHLLAAGVSVDRYTLVERFRLALLLELGVVRCIEIVLNRSAKKSELARIKQVAERELDSRDLSLARALLSGVGASEAEIARALGFKAYDYSSPLEQVLASIVAIGLGAVVVRYQGVECEGFWTLHPDLLESVYQGAQRPVLEPFLLNFIKSLAPRASKGGRRGKRVKRGRSASR
jgi:hypothetical protein